MNLVGTGDFTHPRWINELQRDLIEISDTGLFKSANGDASTHYMISGEVSTIFVSCGKTRKIHHVILTPSFETAKQVNERLMKYGDLTVDGRPLLQMSAPLLIEEVKAVTDLNEVVPAHVWTPWFSLFGAFSGFDRIEDCYQDMTKHIHALETGLSSDPSMNWRISALDRFALVSNSDSHSCWPWRMGREANVFELQQLTYNEILDTLRKKDRQRFKLTIETDPAYGKYHWTGHRECKVSMPPRQALKFGNRCPVCRRTMTKGVEQRVEELADRPVDFKPKNVIGYMRLLPLSEIIATVLGASSPNVQSVWSVYNRLIAEFENEYRVLIDAPRKAMAEIVDPKIGEEIERVRLGKAKVTPGYDGVYGKLRLSEDDKGAETDVAEISQRNITEYV
ncbi:MAG: DNA helicase UvrD [Candidatus Bathyarchaeota archaeon]|nr:MAG: DNA helicase UvrD [Candidatus Bathyarchaeota archaeon]